MFSLRVFPSCSPRQLFWAFIRSGTALFVLGLILAVPLRPLHGGVLGRFEHVKNGPGYLELDDKTSPIYDFKKVMKVKGRKKLDGVEHRSPSQILREDYILEDGLLNVQTIQDKIAGITKLLKNAFLRYCGSKGFLDCEHEQQRTDSKLYRKWQKKKIVLAGHFAIGELSRAMGLADGPRLNQSFFNSPEGQDFLEALFQGLETYEAMKNERYAEGVNVAKVISMVRNILKKVKITHQSPEAVNLDIPWMVPGSERPASRRNFLSLPQGDSDGEEYDASWYDPIESGFWRRPLVAISNFDTSRYNNQLRESFGDKKFLKVKDIENPDIPIDLEYLSPAPSGRTSKMEVRFKGLRMKMKFRSPRFLLDKFTNITDIVRFYRNRNGEVRSEFVANNLAAALGYTVDPTYYKKKIRLFLKDGFNSDLRASKKGRDELWANFKKARNQMADELAGGESNIVPASRKMHKWEYLSFLENTATVESGPQQGRYFIEMESVSLEFRRQQDVDWSVGLFNKHAFGKYLKREFRAFMLFYLWICDLDIKDSNSSLGLVKVEPLKSRKSKTSQGVERKVYYSASDMGASLGGLMGKNLPNYLSYNLVNQKDSRLTGPLEKQVLVFDRYHRVHSPLFQAVNFSDLKWIVRMMAQLTKEQIKKTFLTANYPEVVAELFTQKLLRRRDQLVQGLGLDGEEVRTYGPSPKTFRISGQTSSIKDPESYFVPSCEKCFEKGELTSLPEGTKSNVDWSESIKVFNEGSKQFETVRVLKNLFKAMGAQVIGDSLQRYKVGLGLTFDGVRLHQDSFLPARYLLENPYSDTGNKFWIVDIFRFGVRVGVDLDGDSLDLWPSKNRFMGGVGAIETFEFIKVKPVNDSGAFKIKDLLKIYHPKKMIGTPLKKLKQSLIESMGRGDLVISSRYLTLGGHVEVKTPSFFPGLGAFGAGLIGTVDRVTLLKEEGTGVLVTWSDISNSGLRAGAFFNYWLLRFPLLMVQYKRLREHQSVYRFDLSEDEGKSILLNNINKDLPDRIPQKYAVEFSDIKQSTKQFFASFLALRSFYQYRRTSEIRLFDAEEKLLKNLVSTEKGQGQSAGPLFLLNRVQGTGATAIVDSLEGKMMANIQMKYMKLYAKRKHYIKMVNQFKGLLPPVMVQFDAHSVNYYLGRLRLEGKVLFSDRALRDILGRGLDRMAACETFAQYGRLKWEEDYKLLEADEIGRFCRRVVEERISFDDIAHKDWKKQSKDREVLFGVWSFMKNLSRAQRSFTQFETAFKKGQDTVTKARKLSQAIVNLLDAKGAKGPTHMALMALTSQDNIYRHVEMNSSLEGFPGQKSNIVLHKKVRGNSDFETLPLWKMKRTSELLGRAMEPALTALSPFFYSYYWSNHLSSSLLLDGNKKLIGTPIGLGEK